MRKLILISFMGICFLGSVHPANAQAPKPSAPTNVVDRESSDDTKVSEEEAPKVKIERGAGGKKVYRITTGFVIEGRIQKPNAFYVLQRSQINYGWADLKRDFIPRIIQSVSKHPF